MKRILSFLVLATLAASGIGFAGFASSEVFFASIGRGGGGNGAQFYSTLWVTNLSSSATVQFTFSFLKDGQANLTGAPTFSDTLSPGQTKLYEDVTETKLNLPGQFGAARITADGEIFASERVYNLGHPTDNLGTSEGLFFAAVPKSFAIGLGETASIQGVNQGSPTEDMRTNFDLVETTGNSCKVHVTLLDQNGTSQGATDVPMNPYGHVKESAQALFHSINTINGRIVATVTSGSGQVILAGEQLANTSQDSSGFEMSFKDSLLGGESGGNCTLCVTSLNGLTGAVTIAHGANTTVNVNGSTITIDAVAGSGTGLTAVSHDNSLTGSGTVAVPLAIANGQVVRSLNGLHDAVTLAAGSNITLTPSGSTITIAGSPGGLTLPYSGTGNSFNTEFQIANTAIGAGISGASEEDTGVVGTEETSYGGGLSAGVAGFANDGFGVYGSSSHSNGVYGVSGGISAAIYGQGSSGDGVSGKSTSGNGVVGETQGATATGVAGVQGFAKTAAGVSGTSTSGDGVDGFGGSDGNGVSGLATAADGSGVHGNNTGAGYGVSGASQSGPGVYGTSVNGDGVLGSAGKSSTSGVAGANSSSGPGVSGTSAGGDGVYGAVATAGKAGVSGHFTKTSGSGYGVYGSSDSSSGYGIYSNGNVGGTGAKFFVEPHPTDPTKEIRFVCLEGPESGTYFRGSARIVNGFATIDVPESFRMVTAEAGLTVITTPTGDLAVLACMSKDLHKIVIRGSSDVAFDYVVNGVRKTFAGFQPIAENRDFVPRSADARDLTTGLPEESVRRLKANGTLNPDGSINLETAHRLGWDRDKTWEK